MLPKSIRLLRARPSARRRATSRPQPELLEDRLAPATLPVGFTETLAASGLSNATAMQFAPDGKLFVAEQGGTLEVWQNNTRLQANFFANTPLTVNPTGERGLLGIAFDPDYGTNRYVYAYYTATTPTIHNRVVRFQANAAGDLALAGSATVMLDLETLSGATNHNGGAIHFGPDDMLYIAVGENANTANSQSLNNRLGKILRIDPSAFVPGDPLSVIPDDNPTSFQGVAGTTTGANRAIWAIGLRNPYTSAFQPGTGRFFINDVGGSNTGRREEINDGAAGRNYGWPTVQGVAGNPSFTDPLFDYGPATAGYEGNCAITGGAFYNPASVTFPGSYLGDYFFADFCGGFIKAYDVATDSAQNFATGASSPVDLKVGADGGLYYLARGTGQVWRIQVSGNAAPGISQQPGSQTVPDGGSATFSVVASGTPPLSYQWQRDGVNIPGATSSSYTLNPVTAADHASRFRAVVTNAFGTTASNEAVLTVTSNQAPTAVITAPSSGALYSHGETISFSGTGTDAEDGTLSAGAFSWRVDFHHDDHFHPFHVFAGVSGGDFVADFTEPASNVFYRVHLTVQDSGGLTHSSFVDVHPRTATVTVTATSPGLQVLLDGQPMAAPFTFVGVVNYPRTLTAVSPQTVGGTTYQFVSWSDGGAAEHTIATPAANTTYTATYQSSGGGNGLMATYYNNRNFTGSSVRRVDPTVDFSWGGGSPDAAIASDTFSARWLGRVQPQFSQTYTFYTSSDDGVRLWVNNQLLINNWTDHAPTENSGSIALVAGQMYDIRLDYYENAGGATARLLWSSASTPKAVIPQARLFAASPVASPWQEASIGSVGFGGSASISNGTFNVTGAGADIWGTADAFHFVYQPLIGDGEIVARVTGVQNTDAWAKAGVMIREGLTANSRHAFMALTPGNGLAFQRRVSTGSSSTHTSGGSAAAPYWVRLVRGGNTINGYRSVDGVNWVLVGSAVIPMAQNVYIGLAVTSHNNSALNTSTFGNVVVTP